MKVQTTRTREARRRGREVVHQTLFRVQTGDFLIAPSQHEMKRSFQQKLPGDAEPFYPASVLEKKPLYKSELVRALPSAVSCPRTRAHVHR